MTEIRYDAIVTPELLEGMISNRGFGGFYEDYNVLQALLKIHKPKSVFEIGTCDGSGTKIIKHTIGESGVVFTLDLPTEVIDKSLRVNGGDRVGKNCDLPFIQLRGDSLGFDFSQYPCEAYFIDGAHTEWNVNHETIEVLKNNPKIVIYHDANISEVMNGIIYGWGEANNGDDYELYRVLETRIAYLLKID